MSEDFSTFETQDLDKGTTEALVNMCGETLKGGKVIYARAELDLSGEPVMKALVDYGIAGTKKFTKTVREFIQKYDDEPKRLEDMDIIELKSMAENLGVSIPGRPNRVKLVVAIRAKIKADEKQRIIAERAEMEKPTEEVEKEFATAMAEAVKAVEVAGGSFISGTSTAQDVSLTEDELKKMKVKDLLEMADEMDLEIPSKAKKDEIVAAILDASAGA